VLFGEQPGLSGREWPEWQSMEGQNRALQKKAERREISRQGLEQGTAGHWGRALGQRLRVPM
jgi:hypothetical protein